MEPFVPVTELKITADWPDAEPCSSGDEVAAKVTRAPAI